MPPVVANYINQHRSAILGTTALLTIANIAIDTFHYRKALRAIDKNAAVKTAKLTEMLAIMLEKYPETTLEYKKNNPDLPWPS